MDLIGTPVARRCRTRLFAHWSVELPAGLEPVPGVDGPYWHARDDAHSVSFTSYELTERGRPVTVDQMVQQRVWRILPGGTRIEDGPEGLLAWAVYARSEETAVASWALHGVVVAHGYLLITTITSDDEDWCREVWTSIHHHALRPTPRNPPAARRRGRGR